MLRVSSFAAFAAAALLTAAARADFDRDLTVSGPVDLYVSTGAGALRIHPGSDNQVHIHAHVYASWNAGGNIQQRIDRINQQPPVQQSGAVIHVGEVPAEDRPIYNNIAIDYDITAPRSAALNLRTGSGDIAVQDVGRFLKAWSGSGSLRVTGIAGPAELETGSGDIDLADRAPGTVSVRTGSGSIRIHGFDGALTARTGSGEIDARGAVTGISRLQTGSGSIRLHAGPNLHANVEASTGSGDIRLPNTPTSDHHHIATSLNGGGPTIHLQTGSGDIELD